RCRATVLEAQTLCGGVESRDTRPEAQLDALLLVVLGPAERNPVLLGRAGQVVLRQVGPIDWWIAVRADHRRRPVLPFAPEHLGRGEAGGATADDDDRGW